MTDQSPPTESAMDILKKKVLNSPLGKRKSGSPATKTFGVPLEDLTTRSGSPIPFVVKKTVDFIQNHGIGHEGIFRISGSAKVVEKLKASFDKTGDANLEDAGDVMAVAGLLKQFLREMPDSVIPESMTDQFIDVQQNHSNDSAEFVEKMLPLLDSLPADNVQLLKYLVRFLVQVSMKEETNKMTPMAIGIVFGPNLFRCKEGLEGLKQQGLTNHIVCKFIQHYDELFKSENEQSPYTSKVIQSAKPRKPPNSFVVQEAKSPRTPPARPPPPKFVTDRELTDTLPIPSPRLSKIKYEAGLYQDDQVDSRTNSPRSRNSMLSPRLAEDEVMSSRASPFMLDSECGSSYVQSPSPILSLVASELVEKTISEAVSEHLFGGGLLSWSSDEGRTESPDKGDGKSPVPAPRRKRRKNKLESTDSLDEEKEHTSYDDDRLRSVKERVGVLEQNMTDTVDGRAGSDVRETLAEMPGDVFEGMEHTQAAISLAVESDPNHMSDMPVNTEQAVEEESQGSCPVPKPRSPRKSLSHGRPEASFSFDSVDSEFGSLEISTPLHVYKRAKGPKNRSPPSRAKLKQKLVSSSQQSSPGVGEGDDVDSSSKYQDVNHNDEKPSVGFLDIPYQAQLEVISPAEPSPNSKKPFIPPLDLTTLHEHGDGNDPILAEQGPSVFQMGKGLKQEEPVLSPRSHKLRKKSGAHPDTDVAPSPPGGQQSYSASSVQGEEDQAVALKNLTKKIQTLKKKIKQFEDHFEEEKGYKPSQSDKNAKPDVKRYITELNKARKDLKQLKEKQQAADQAADDRPSSNTRPESATRSASSKSRPTTAKIIDRPTSGKDRPTSGRSASSDERQEEDAQNEPPTMARTLDQLLKRLMDKRMEGGRPADLNSMSRDQVQEEKLAVQKALLHFESIHGRPTTKQDKELMRPLYDRYRNVKKLLAAKPASPKDKVDLEPVPENHSMNFTQKEKPSAEELGTTDFMVTQNLALLKETTQHNVVSDSKAEDSDNEEGDSPDRQAKTSGHSHLHALSVRELLDEQHRAKLDKKHLRKILREFEDGFQKQHGRKVLKEDRAPMATEYEDYKQVKSKLRLLEALISKHDGTANM